MDRNQRMALGAQIHRALNEQDMSREALVAALAERGVRVSTKTVSNIRRGNTAGDVDTLIAMAAVLGIPVMEASANEPVVAAGSQDAVDRAVATYERAIGDLLQAEKRLDAVLREYAASQVVYNKAEAQYRQEAGIDGGAPLDLDAHEQIAQMSAMHTASPAETAEMVAWIAAHWPRDWTRMEMALVEYVFDDYPQDVEKGSHLDLAPARELARRLRPLRSRDVEPVSGPAPTLRAVAKEGVIEEFDED